MTAVTDWTEGDCLGRCSRVRAHHALYLGKVIAENKGRLFRQVAFVGVGLISGARSLWVYQMETMTPEAKKPMASPTRTSEM
jgi:hypothetical protein